VANNGAMLAEAQLDEYAAQVWQQNPKLALSFVDIQHFQSALEVTLNSTTTSALGVADAAERLNAECDLYASERLAAVRNPASDSKLSRIVHYSNSRIVIWLYGMVGSQIRAAEIFEAIDSHPATPIVLRICSAGGDAEIGLDIAERLSRARSRTIAVVDAYAFSAAADIAMSCDRLLIRKNATMLIHCTRKVCIGNADQILDKVAGLNSTDQRAAGLCARKRRISARKLYELARAASYLCADEALSVGVADAVIPALPIYTEMK
jgi:ATP-dependent protease ClpP protease subunit